MHEGVKLGGAKYQMITIISCRRWTDEMHCFKVNSHRHAGHDKTVLSVSRPLRRYELDFRQLKTVADRKFEV